MSEHGSTEPARDLDGVTTTAKVDVEHTGHQRQQEEYERGVLMSNKKTSLQKGCEYTLVLFAASEDAKIEHQTRNPTRRPGGQNATNPLKTP